MIVTVYHHDFPDHPDALVAVAAIDAGTPSGHPEALEFAFHRTQNIDGSWSQGLTLDNGRGFLVDNPDHHPAITVLAPLHQEGGKVYGLRSSMMGDVFEVEGRRYRVAMMGFEEITGGAPEAGRSWGGPPSGRRTAQLGHVPGDREGDHL